MGNHDVSASGCKEVKVSGYKTNEAKYISKVIIGKVHMSFLCTVFIPATLLYVWNYF